MINSLWVRKRSRSSSCRRGREWTWSLQVIFNSSSSVWKPFTTTRTVKSMTHFAFTPDLSSWTNRVQTLCDSVPLRRLRSFWTLKLQRQITSASKTCASRRRATTELLCSWRKSRSTASFQSTTFIAAVLSSFLTSPSAVFSTTNELSRSSQRRLAS